MIKRVTIKELFGIYNYDLSFSNDENLKIITGPNGFGKTTLLRIIQNLQASNFWYFYFLVFSSIKIEYENDTILITKGSHASQDTGQDTDTSTDSFVSFVLNDSDSANDVLVIDAESIRKQYRNIRRSIPTRIFDEGAIDVEKLFEQFYTQDNELDLFKTGNDLRMFLSVQSKCLFISEQRITKFNIGRLYRRPYEPFEDKRLVIENEVEKISTELVELFKKADTEFAMKAQRYDATFIYRLIDSPSEFQCYTEDEYEQERIKITEKINALRKYGIVSMSEDRFESYRDRNKYKEHNKVLSLYMRDMNKKLSVYDDLYKKLNLLNKLISSQGLSNKHLVFSKTKGLEIRSDIGSIVPLTKLSSGEQNILILYFKLLFSVSKGYTLLIDEPENSLHMAWLGGMLKDYLEIARIMQCQIIIATHSPVLIDGRWDLSVDLFDIHNQQPA